MVLRDASQDWAYTPVRMCFIFSQEEFPMFVRSPFQQSGATVVEYALMVTFVAMAVVVTVVLLGQTLDTRYEEIVECVRAMASGDVAAACD